MAQVTIYMDNNLERKVKEVANSLNLSISKFISSLLEKNIQNEWNENIKNLSGSWSDFPTLDEIRESKVDDVKREEF